MARRSPLFVGALIAAAVVGSADVAFVLRPRHHARPPAPPPDEDPGPVAAAPPSPRPRTPRGPTARSPTGASLPPPSPPAPQPLRVAGEQPVDAAAHDPGLTGRALQWRALAIAGRNSRVIKEADERAFEGLSLPEDARAAIRRINEDYLRRKQELQVPPGATPAAAGAGDSQPDRERRAALEQLLGEDGARQLHDAENTSALQVRPANGRPWFHPSQQ